MACCIAASPLLFALNHQILPRSHLLRGYELRAQRSSDVSASFPTLSKSMFQVRMSVHLLGYVYIHMYICISPVLAKQNPLKNGPLPSKTLRAFPAPKKRVFAVNRSNRNGISPPNFPKSVSPCWGYQPFTHVSHAISSTLCPTFAGP